MYKSFQLSILLNSRKSNIKKICSSLQLSTSKIQKNNLVAKSCPSLLSLDHLVFTKSSPYSQLSLRSHVYNANNLLQTRLYSSKKHKKSSNGAQKRDSLKPNKLEKPPLNPENVLNLLRTYQKVYGHLRVHKDFVVPAGEALGWPKEMWNAKLGKLLYHDIRNIAQNKSIESKVVEELGFQYLTDEEEYRAIKEALGVYKEFYGDLLVPLHYTIGKGSQNKASSPTYPPTYQGMRLGLAVEHIRHANDFASKKAELMEMGLFYPESSETRFSRIRIALTEYKSVYGHLNVPKEFVVPVNNHRFTYSSQGMNLGFIVHDIRENGGYQDQKDILAELGLTCGERLEGFDLVKLALTAYKDIHRDLFIPSDYVIRVDDPNFPESTKGMKLGEIVRNIRQHQLYSEHKGELLVMGLDYENQLNDKFSMVKDALVAFKQIYGNLFVPKSFVIPLKEAAYPQVVRGMQLGKVVAGIRNHDYYEEHLDELIKLGFPVDGNWIRFKVLRQALDAFKTIHGHLMVPYYYIIPFGDSPYPDAVKGLRLGDMVVSIRNHGYFSEQRKELQALGLDYDCQLLDFELLRQAIVAYSTAYGDINTIDPSFTVKKDDIRFPPSIRGKNLGRRIDRIKYLEDYRKYRKELLELGVQFHFQPKPFPLFKTALLKYKEIYGDNFVPYVYSISKEDTRFAEEVRGLRLGKYVDCIKTGHIYQDNLDELQEIGFPYLKIEFSLVEKALETYKAIHGDLLVPSDYTIPAEDTRYPVALRGNALGKVVHRIRTRHAYEEHRETLLGMGFDYNILTKDFSFVKKALQAYHSIHGDFLVPYDYVVPPDDERFPEDLRYGMKLGKIVNCIRNDRYAYLPEQKQELLALGFDFNKPVKDFEIVKEALLIYRQIHGDFAVPFDYIIPAEDTRYPEELRYGVRLGKIVNGIRNKQYYAEAKDELVAMGFDFTTTQVRDFALVKEALLIYKQLHGHLFVPRDYVIPFNDTNYPPALRYGVRLGKIVSGIRNSLFYKEHKTELLAIGFEFDKKRSDFDTVKQSLLVYKELHGDFSVPYDYVVPNDERFPESARKGMRLGKILNGIRNNGYYPENREELMALGIDFDFRVVDFDIMKDALVAYQQIYRDLNVPPTYIVPENDTRFPEGIRGKDLGRRVTRIRNMDDYRKYRKQLLELGIVFSFQPIAFHVFRTAILKYKEIYGVVTVPNNYSVPHDDVKFPEELRGIRLGKYVACVRTGHIYQEHLAELQELGLYDSSVVTFPLIKTSLSIYRDIHGNYDIPYDYRIPADDVRFPEPVRNLKLGKLVNGIRCHGHYMELESELKEIGFDFDKNKGQYALIEQALLTYKAINGDLMVPREFSVAADDSKFPEAVRGMRLGKIVYNIRTRGNYKLFREELIAIGFKFDVDTEKK